MPVQYATNDNYHPTGMEGASMGAREGGAVGGPWGALGGAVGGYIDNQFLGGTAYKLLHKTPKTPVAPDWVKIDPFAIRDASIAQDKLEYDRADKQWALQNPLLAAARDATIATNASDVSGRNTAVAGALDSAGLTSEGGHFMTGGGLAGEENQARDLGMPITALANRDRNYFSKLFSENPRRAFGPNASDYLSMEESNAEQKAINDQALLRSQTNAYNSSQAQQSQDNAAAATTAAYGFETAINDYYKHQREQDPGFTASQR